jgi:hypothetical protein
MRKSRKARRWVVSLLILGGAAAVMFPYLIPGEPLLLPRSSQIASLKGFDSYYWLSPSDLLLYRYMAGPGIATSLTPIPVAPVEINIFTSQRTTLAPFASRLPADYYSHDLQTSPDGKWALSDIPSRPTWTSFALALDGSQFVERISKAEEEEAIPASDMVWLRDSRRWVRLTLSEGKLVASTYSLDSTEVRHSEPFSLPRGTSSDKSVSVFSHLLGEISKDRILATPAEIDPAAVTGPDREICFYTVNIGSGQPNVSEYTIRVPKTTLPLLDGKNALSFREQVVLSPKGDRLAWLLYSRRETPPFRRFMNRFFSGSRSPISSHVTISVSGIDGSNFRTIGGIDEQTTNPNAFPLLLRWTPDGRRLSFIYKDAVWTVPAD